MSDTRLVRLVRLVRLIRLIRLLRIVVSGLAVGIPASQANASPVPASSAAAASVIQSQAHAAALEQLKTLAAKDGLTDAQITLAVLPPKPPLPACPRPFTFSIGDARQLGRMTVTARCPETGAPFRLIARATVKATVPVAARDIEARQPIVADDLADEPRDIASLTDTVTRAEDAIGRSSRRAVHAGQILRRRHLQTPELIRRGQTVRVVARVGQAEIVNTGVAMQSGGKDDVIPIRVGGRSNRKTVDVRITAAGTAEPVGLPTPPSAR